MGDSHHLCGLEPVPALHRQLAVARFHLYPGDSSGFCTAGGLSQLSDAQTSFPGTQVFIGQEQNSHHRCRGRPGCLFCGPVHRHRLRKHDPAIRQCHRSRHLHRSDAGGPAAGGLPPGDRTGPAGNRRRFYSLRLCRPLHAGPDCLQGDFHEPLRGPDDHVHRRHLRHPPGCFRHHRFSLRAFRRHARQGRGGPVFYPAGPESAGRLQRRSGQGGRHGQRAYRTGLRIEHRQHRHHRYIHHPL